ncbi:MAG: serine hydrolase [Desulfamplus sp.]|nr:serine hydrolase [Desulfamplus sp.]
MNLIYRYVFIVMSIAVLACAQASGQTEEKAPSGEYWPTQAWHTATPEQQGMDSEKLAESLDFVRRNEVDIHSLLIIRNGHIVLDASFYPFRAEQLHDLASVTKSVTSTLIGVAIGRQKLSSVRQPLLSLFPQRPIANRDERKEGVTIKDLLTMTSGLDCRFQPHEITLSEMKQSKDWIQFMLNLPMAAEPGSKYEYCSGGFHLLSGIISQTTGASTLDFARHELFQPLGVQDVVWPSDPNGVTHGWGDLHLRSHDAAKIGYLWLNRGRWEDRQIVPAEWMQDAIQVHSRASWGDEYGYGIWVNPTRDLYEGNGRGGQRLSVVPSKNLVVVFAGGGFEPGDIGKFIVAALKSDKPLPENRAGVARLAAAITTASKPPVPKSMAKLPEIARAISGKTYLLEANHLGLKTLAITFAPQSDASVRLTFADNHTEMRPIGLDGVARLSPDGRFGLPVGVKGYWEDEHVFVLDYDEVANINHYLLRIGFNGDRIAMQLSEKTSGSEAKFEGKMEAK